MLSIIIPSFNRAHSLPAAIESVLNQTYDNWELIIIDDGSTDSTAGVIEKYKNDTRVRYYYQDNLGVSAARNLGATKARGKYLIFLDSDDSFKPGLVQRLAEIEFWNYDLICWEVLKNIDGKFFHWKPVGLENL